MGWVCYIGESDYLYEMRSYHRIAYEKLSSELVYVHVFVRKCIMYKYYVRNKSLSNFRSSQITWFFFFLFSSFKFHITFPQLNFHFYMENPVSNLMLKNICVIGCLWCWFQKKKKRKNGKFSFFRQVVRFRKFPNSMESEHW